MTQSIKSHRFIQPPKFWLWLLPLAFIPLGGASCGEIIADTVVDSFVECAYEMTLSIHDECSDPYYIRLDAEDVVQEDEPTLDPAIEENEDDSSFHDADSEPDSEVGDIESASENIPPDDE